MSSITPTPKVCLTASGCLIWDDKVLLVKHKKAGIWLKPGGHVEVNELPHQTAQREFFEETGIRVKLSRFGFLPELEDKESEFVPLPFAANVHLVSRENFWQRGCEQHCNFDYFVEPVDALRLEFTENSEEINGIGWFLLSQLDELETTGDIRSEIKYAFTLVEKLR